MRQILIIRHFPAVKMRLLSCSLVNGLRSEESVITSLSQPRYVFPSTIPIDLSLPNTPIKYTTNYKRGDTSIKTKVNYTGNNVKSMHMSVEASLKKLRTTYIDILYVHWWDWETSVEEVMNGLHNLVQQGKVLYLVRLLFYLLVYNNDSKIFLLR